MYLKTAARLEASAQLEFLASVKRACAGKIKGSE